MSHGAEQKTIAKNTIFLYLRMFVVMIVSFYTSRVVLDKLGVDDYGIYNIVGSVVVSFAFVRNALQSASQRFLSFSKGQKDDDCSKVFTTSMNIHFFIILVVVILLETVGLWFLNNVINIPADRVSAAKIVYQFSILTFCASLVQVPYTSLIVSNEKMSIYAYISIIEVVLKLVIVFALSFSDSIDKLVLYGALMLLVTFVQVLITASYCRKVLKDDSKYLKYWNKGLFKDILSFSGWNLIGGLSGMACAEGPNYFMNFYLGVKVNAAMGIAKQVSNVVYGFSSNFQNAFNPQIIKAYASDEKDYLFDLIFRTSKMSFILIYIIAAPLIVCCNDVLNIWLTVVPAYTGTFCICILLSQIVSAISSPLWMAAHAIGNIKVYQLVLAVINITIIPVSWFVLHFGYEPYYILIYQIIMNFIVLVYRVRYLSQKLSFPSLQYYREVVGRCVFIIPALTFPLIYLLHERLDGFIGVVVTSVFAVAVIISAFLYLGLNSKERTIVISFLMNRIKKH